MILAEVNDDGPVSSNLEQPSLPEYAYHCWPEDAAFRRNVNWFQRQYQSWTYSYMRPILRNGANQNAERRLSQYDLFPVPTTMESQHLSKLFQKHFLEASSCCCDKGVHARSNPQTRQLLKTLWRLAAPTFVPAGFCQLLTVLCQVGLPLLVRGLLKVIEDNPNEQVIGEGMPYALSIFAVAFVNTFGNHRHRHLALKSGIVMRAATINILYSRVLRLTPKGKAGLTSGEVTNLIATGTYKLRRWLVKYWILLFVLFHCPYQIPKSCTRYLHSRELCFMVSRCLILPRHCLT